MIGLHHKVSGRYRARVFKESGEVTKETGWFDNLITDNGLDLMNNTGYLSECAVGTGNSTPAVTDTALDSLVASTSDASRTDSVDSGVAPFIVKQTATFTFSAGSAAGNLAEIGVGITGSNLLSRALIEDAGGNPTTITVLSDEILVVDYEFIVEVPTTDNTGTVTINGTDYDWTGRVSDIDNWSNTSTGKAFSWNTFTSNTEAYDGSIGTTSGSPTGSVAASSSVNLTSYTSGDYASELNITWDPGVANFGSGISAVSSKGDESQFFYQIGFSPAIPKTSDDEFTLSISHSWGRA